MRAYKSLTKDGLTTFRKFGWSLPEYDQPGEWITIEGKAILCQNGFHAWLAKEVAVKEGAQVWEVELDELDLVKDNEKACSTRARFIKLVYTFEPIVIEKGIRNCIKCGKPHDAIKVASNLAPSWAAPDGHAYIPEEWEDYIFRLQPREKIEGYRKARKNIIRQQPQPPGTSYSPVVPSFHDGPFKEWSLHENRCGTCGLSRGLHDGWEQRAALNKEFFLYDRWELLMVIQQMRNGEI